MTITIHNFRAGFATNSSSSHSVVLIPQEMVGKIQGVDEYSDEFGWNQFTLTTPESKLRYLAAQLMGGPDLALIEKAAGMKVALSDSAYVDHQSYAALPDFGDNYQTLVRLFMSPRVVVLGGNDNGGDHPGFPGMEEEPVMGAAMGYGKVLRRDGEYFIMFNKENGHKVRISYTEGVPEYTKATTPELVDLKITDYCDRGCAFCYQSSTTAGKHAKFGDIAHVIENLHALEVFEIALGGGEPTTHPEFAKIIETIGEAKMTPNFTTLSDSWLSDPAIMRAVNSHVGAIGVSCASAKDLRLHHKISHQVYKRVVAQHVVGSVPLEVTGDFLREAFEQKIPVLLLGYKQVGFGKQFTRHDHGDVPFFLKMAVERHEDVDLSVDTALVDRFPDLAATLGAPRALVTSPEGKFSCYIDAVTKTMGPSSYVEPDTMQTLPKDANSLRALFATY